jgi:DNA-binding NtrC family response regulator
MRITTILRQKSSHEGASFGQGIVIVDQDVSTLQLLEQILCSLGHEATACTDAETALDTYQKEPYPLVVLDWQLPDMDGLQLCRQIRSLPEGDNTMILVTGRRNQPEDLKVVLEAGANDYLTKPVSVGLLKLQLAIAEREQFNHTGQTHAELGNMLTRIKKNQDELLSLLNQVFLGASVAGNGAGISGNGVSINGNGFGVAGNSMRNAVNSPPRAVNSAYVRASSEQKRLLTALDQAGGNRTIAARILGISRATLYRHLTKLGLIGSE